MSAGVALKLHGERETRGSRRCSTFRDVATDGMYGSIVVLLIAGVTAAFIAGLWGRGWIWAAIALLVLMFAAMYARAPTWPIVMKRFYASTQTQAESSSPALPPIGCI